MKNYGTLIKIELIIMLIKLKQTELIDVMFLVGILLLIFLTTHDSTYILVMRFHLLTYHIELHFCKMNYHQKSLQSPRFPKISSNIRTS